MKFSCNISLKFSRRQNFMKSYITNCDQTVRRIKMKLGTLVKQQYLPHMSLQYGELRRTSGWDCLLVWGTPQLISTGQPNFAALNRGRHLHSAGRPSRWALAHISSLYCILYLYVSCNSVRMSHWNKRLLTYLLTFFLSFYLFLPRLISTTADWMSAILPHIMRP